MVISGTIRSDYALAVARNIYHGSDSVESAEKEIALYVNPRFLYLHAHKLCLFQLVPQWYRVVCSCLWVSEALLTPCVQV